MGQRSILACHAIADVDFVRGEGPYLWDAEGRRYVDLESGSWAVALGHCERRVGARLKEQADRLVHLAVRNPNRQADAAAIDVLGITGLDGGKCVFLSSGSEAVEFGVQAARRLSGRPLMLRFSTSYLAAFGSAGRASPEEWVSLDWRKAATDPEAAIAALPFDRIGGFALETGGASPEFVDFPPEPLVRAVVDRVRAEGGYVVANEITTGMGRTGRWFGYMHYGVVPDIVAIGKGLGNGYPVSAVAMSAGVADLLEESGLHYAQSHQNDPLGCAVASEVIAVMKADGLVERAASTGERFLGRLRASALRIPSIRAVRGRGMLLAVELVPGALDGVELQSRLWDEGFIVSAYPADHPSGTGIRMDPPLSLPLEEADRFAECLERVLVGA